MSGYHYAYCRANGQITISRKFEDWDTCYEEYCQEMMQLATREDLSSYKWRGVWDEIDLPRVLSAELTSMHHTAFTTITQMEG